MTWSLSAAGNEEAADEEKVIAALRKAFKSLPDAANIHSANLVTQHHGGVNLLDDTRKPEDEPKDPDQVAGGRRQNGTVL